jgi:hypothetical protein
MVSIVDCGLTDPCRFTASPNFFGAMRRSFSGARSILILPDLHSPPFPGAVGVASAEFRYATPWDPTRDPRPHLRSPCLSQGLLLLLLTSSTGREDHYSEIMWAILAASRQNFAGPIQEPLPVKPFATIGGGGAWWHKAKTWRAIISGHMSADNYRECTERGLGTGIWRRGGRVRDGIGDGEIGGPCQADGD